MRTLADFTGGAIAVTDGLVLFVGGTNGTARIVACLPTGCATLSGLGAAQSGFADRIALVPNGTNSVGYVFNYSSGIQSTSRTGSTCTNLAIRQVKANAAPPLAATASSYYYGKRVSAVLTGIARCPDSEPTCVTVSDVSSITNGIARMATTPSDMFFLWAGGPGGGSAIGHCPIAGCPSAGAPAIIRTSTMTFTDMTAAVSDVFWIDGGALRTCSAASCAAPHDLATGLVGADYLVVDGSFVYWIEGANGPSGAIERVAL